jgi:hypothetical protein
VAGTCGYGEELSGSINAANFLTSCKVSFSRRTLLHGVEYSKYVYLRTSPAQAPKYYHNPAFACIIRLSRVLEFAIYKLLVYIKN